MFECVASESFEKARVKTFSFLLFSFDESQDDSENLAFASIKDSPLRQAV
jgi:hypothetical protein